MASQIDFDRNAEQLPIELASVVGTAAGLHMLSASSQVTSRSWVGRRRRTASPTSKSNGDISARGGCNAPVRAESAWPRPCKLSCSQPKLQDAGRTLTMHRQVVVPLRSVHFAARAGCYRSKHRYAMHCNVCATRPRELPSSVKFIIVHIAMLSGSYACLVLSEMRQGRR
jgi:hypothetical protein